MQLQCLFDKRSCTSFMTGMALIDLYALAIASSWRAIASKKMCIPLLWEKTVSKFPRRTAIIDAESGRKLTFDELNQFSNAVYNVLKDNGAEKSDGVALIMPNCVEYGYDNGSG